MPLPISTEEMQAYRAAAADRAEALLQRREVRRRRALAVARDAAEILRKEYGARRVAVFGSVLSPDHFHETSDLDLAVWGCDVKSYLRAVARLLALDPTISVDLIEVERARPALVAAIEQEGENL